jgi:hypothetical protein
MGRGEKGKSVRGQWQAMLDGSGEKWQSPRAAGIHEVWFVTGA